MKANSFLELDDKGNIIVKFGKYKGDFLSDVAMNNPDYLDWALQELDVSDDVALEIELALQEADMGY